MNNERLAFECSTNTRRCTPSSYIYLNFMNLCQ